MSTEDRDRRQGKADGGNEAENPSDSIRIINGVSPEGAEAAADSGRFFETP